MTKLQTGTTRATTVPVWAGSAGMACLVAGSVGAVSGVVHAVYPGRMFHLATLGYALWTTDER